MTAQHDFPLVNLHEFETTSSTGRLEYGSRVDTICRRSGFLAITGHGVPADLIETMWDETRKFFDLPLEQKLKARPRQPGDPYGYFTVKSEALARSRAGMDGGPLLPDLKESFSCGPIHPLTGREGADELAFCYAPTPWSAVSPAFHAAWIAYYDAMEKLAERIMRLFACALGLPEAYFNPYFRAPISSLRGLNYPEQDTAPQPGQIRAGAHSDYGTLTLLLPQQGSGGLEILGPDGQWQAVPAIPDAFVINIGDLMALWTNNRWVSTVHRVVNPPSSRKGQDRRQSLAFFQQPDWDSMIEALPNCVSTGHPPVFSPVRSGTYLMNKFRSTQ
ncbi:2OG-Fe(II) oxygenase [Komagataeibacter rhaeticus]|uniref:isopenicillin N synthase family dioxygenase n=1 Tax=Komagataeibacter rhaeticus TaxID=215221 RepID=UPI000D86C0EA|nr:2OG-Fe(II) oxygenase family protein [Komagataeibacter rhaeticus]MBL7239225.1 isopenicillin N synthase family oxygenase [Komagataeibacter rhaeticus]PYD52506.1 2OG-Fe(II) oxygenase [Komagataeibacter rhaeticus]